MQKPYLHSLMLHLQEALSPLGATASAQACRPCPPRESFNGGEGPQGLYTCTLFAIITAQPSFLLAATHPPKDPIPRSRIADAVP